MRFGRGVITSDTRKSEAVDFVWNNVGRKGMLVQRYQESGQDITAQGLQLIGDCSVRQRMMIKGYTLQTVVGSMTELRPTIVKRDLSSVYLVLAGNGGTPVRVRTFTSDTAGASIKLVDQPEHADALGKALSQMSDACGAPTRPWWKVWGG